jgi:predicted MPP superfamily phosphohydrolase
MRKMTRRSFLKAFVAAVATYAIGGTGLYYYSDKFEMHRPVVDHVEIPIADLADDLVGFRIVAMGDLHIDPTWDFELIEKAFALANQANPDLMLLLGDYISWDITAFNPMKDQLAGLNAKYGVYACLGNHEVWLSATVSREKLESMGITVLLNAGTTIQVGDATLYVAGLDSCWNAYGSPDLDKALADVQSDDVVVVMVHEPDYADITAQDGRVDLQLSGHSHGGQVVLPLLGPIYSAPYSRKYPIGLYQVGDMWQYTTRGIGVSTGAPLRVNCPPEVTEIELVRANNDWKYSRPYLR